MKPVFVDAFFYVALLDKKDAFHIRALEFAKSYEGNFVTSQWVIVEVANWFGRTSVRQKVALLAQLLQCDSTVRIIAATAESFEEGLKLYAARPDKHWSLTDCISFWIMKSEGLTEALTRDHHFAQAGFTPLFADPQ